MLEAVALAVASLSVMGTPDLRLLLSARSEARTNTVAGRSVETSTYASAEVSPRAGVAVDAGDWELAAAYAPRLHADDLAETARPEVVDEGLLRATVRTGRGTAEAAAVGTRGVIDPLADPSVLSRPMPVPGPLRYQALRATLTTTYALDPRTSAAARGGWHAGGGASSAARELVPTQQGVEAEASVERVMTPRDRLRGTLAAARTVTIEERTEAAWARAGATWTRRMAPTVEVLAGGGVAVTHEAALGRPAADAVVPVGEAGVAYARDDGVIEGGIQLRTAPAFDTVSGEVRTVVETIATARWRATTRWSMAAAANGAVTAREPDTAFGGGSIALRWQRGAGSVELGVRARAFVDQRPEVPSFTEAGTFVASTFEFAAR